MIVHRFQTNNMLIYSQGLLYQVASYKHLFWFKVQFLSIALSRVALHAQLFDTVNVNNTFTVNEI